MSAAVNGGFASLTSSLLARKGAAKPAMRPTISTNLDDLGWNDMGEEQAQAVPAEARAVPQPLKYQETIAEEFSAPIEAAEPVKPVVAVSNVVRPIKSGIRVTRKPQPAVGKIAFTLRLDAERHLKLRLATAMTNRSAQKIVSDALDAFLAAHPEIDELAGHVPPLKAEGRN